MLSQASIALAYDFSSRTEYSFEEALDSVWLYYSINPDGTTVSVTQGPEKYKFNHIRIPETVSHNNNTYTVTEIAYSAFAGSNIDIVEMPNTITIINGYAFSDSSVDSVAFSENLKIIGNYAFSDSDLKSVILHEGVESIGDYAFKGDVPSTGIGMKGEISKIRLPNSLKSIGESAFCYNPITHVIIPKGITDINKYAFAGCLNLKDVVFPDALKKIGDAAFFRSGINELNFPSTVEEIGKYAFEECKNLKKVVLPNSVKVIGERCFNGCSILQSITFSSGMTVIPHQACYYCEQLIDVKIPESITSIGQRAFYRTIRLSSISLPDSITYMGLEAFASSGVTSFKFPSKLETLNSGIFSWCNYLTEIEIPSTIKHIGTGTFSNCKSLKKVILPEGINEIGNNVFSGCSKLTDVNIPTTVKTIGQTAFENCKLLKEITLPDGLETIGGGAFSGCVITFMDFPKTVKIIGGCFKGCDSLKIVNIYHNVSKIEQYAFEKCPNLKEVHLKRAIIPNIGSYNTNYPAYIDNGNNCTLYVPTGSKATYEASQYWNNFDTIVEEEIGYDILYRVTASKTGQGTISINNESKTSVDILSGTKVNVAFTPASGWKLKSVVLNDKDITALLVENVYEVESLEANMVFVATFEELPATLSLRSADGGSIDVSVVKGTTFSCVFTPDENWSINNVRYNNRDVTSSVSETGEYTTPVIKSNAILSVAYETGDNSVDAIGIDADMKAYVLTDGLLVVEGVEHGMPVVLYDVDGKILSSLVAVDGRCSYQLPDVGVYIVKGISKTIKVIF